MGGGGGGILIKKVKSITSLSQDQMHVDVWQKHMVVKIRKYIYKILENILKYIQIYLYALFYKNKTKTKTHWQNRTVLKAVITPLHEINFM